MRILASSLRRSIPYFFLKLLLASIILKLSMLVICGNPLNYRNICDPPKTTKVSAIPPKDAAKQPAASSQQPAASSQQPAASRSEERRVGKAFVITGRYRWSQYH